MYSFPSPRGGFWNGPCLNMEAGSVRVFPPSQMELSGWLCRSPLSCMLELHLNPLWRWSNTIDSKTLGKYISFKDHINAKPWAPYENNPPILVPNVFTECWLFNPDEHFRGLFCTESFPIGKSSVATFECAMSGDTEGRCVRLVLLKKLVCLGSKEFLL